MKIYTAIDDSGLYNDDFRYGGTYLHGQIQDDNEYDIFAFGEATDFKEGVHVFKVNERWCIFFLWRIEGFVPTGEWRGYLIYANDYEELEFASKRFNERREHI